MNNCKCGIVLACFDEAEYIERCIRSCLTQQTDADIQIFVADDGSSDETANILRQIVEHNEHVFSLYLEHNERGIARNKAIELAVDHGFDYILIIDCDMVLQSDTVAKCVDFSIEHSYGAIVIPEYAFSDSTNYWTQVKVFERNTIYHAGDKLDSHSIEGARFWTREAFLRSGGFNSKQIAFEEIQPTLRYIAQGGKVGRITNTHIMHDEKHVTLISIIRKKAFYFSQMPTTIQTEQQGLRNMLSRWYFFRPVLYRKENLLRYVKKPHLALGMYCMYFVLTIVGISAILRRG